MKIVSPTFSCKMRCYILETPCKIKGVHKTGVGANKNIEMKGVQQFSNELNDPHAFILDNILRYLKHISDFL